jgi:hypothetical protein
VNEGTNGGGPHLIIPGYVAEPESGRYMPHLKHIHEYLEQQTDLDASEKTAIAMIALVAQIKQFASVTPRHGRGRIIASATEDLRRKLLRYL